MHECLLFANIPSTQHEHILKVLAGISAMQPLPIKEHHLVFKPKLEPFDLPQQTSIPGRPGPGGKPGSQIPAATAQASNDLFYLQLVGDLTRERTAVQTGLDHALGDDEGESEDAAAPEHHEPLSTTNPDVEMGGTENENDSLNHDPNTNSAQEDTNWSAHPWTVEFKNLPDVLGKRPANSRLTTSMPIVDGNPRTFLEALGYIYTTSYLLLGNRLTHNSLSIRLFKTIPLTNPRPPGYIASNSSHTMTEGMAIYAANNALPKVVPSVPDDEASLSALPGLDTSGGYILEVIVKVTDGSKPELMNAAFAELTAFRDTLRGVVSLEPVERLVLDPRVREMGVGGATAATMAVPATRPAVRN